MQTREQIVEEILEQVFNPDTSRPESQDTRTLMVKTAADAVIAIESMDKVTDPVTEEETNE